MVIYNYHDVNYFYCIYILLMFNIHNFSQIIALIYIPEFYFLMDNYNMIFSTSLYINHALILLLFYYFNEYKNNHVYLFHIQKINDFLSILILLSLHNFREQILFE